MPVWNLKNSTQPIIHKQRAVHRYNSQRVSYFVRVCVYILSAITFNFHFRRFSIRVNIRKKKKNEINITFEKKNENLMKNAFHYPYSLSHNYNEQSDFSNASSVIHIKTQRKINGKIIILQISFLYKFHFFLYRTILIYI